MATDITVDGNTAVWFVPTIASATLAPTVAEIGAGKALQERLRADGLENFEPTTARVDNTSLASTFDTSTPGRTAFGDVALVLKKVKVGDADAVFDTLSVKNTSGYLVIRDGVPQGNAAASGQKVAVYPILTGQWAYLPREPNSVLRYRVPTPVSAEPAQNVSVLV